MAAALTSFQIYKLLEARVLPVLLAHQSDLTVHDRNTLADYKGPFLLSYRPMGTNLLVLGGTAEFLIAGDTRTPAAQVQHTITRKRAEVAWDAQQHFLFFDGATFHQLSQTEALQLVDERCGQVLATIQGLKKRVQPA